MKKLDKNFYIKKIKEKKNIFQYILLAIIVLTRYLIRTQAISKLKSTITGKYLPQALDPYYFLRLAETIIEKGSLPAIDLLRSYPLGQALSINGGFMSYALIAFNKFINIFSTSSLDYTTMIFSPFILILASIILFLLIKRILGWKTALLSTLILNILPSFLHRTSIGFSDHDILGIFFLLLTLYLFIVAWQSKKTKHNILFGILSSLSLILGLLAAGNAKIAMLTISVFFFIKIILNKIDKKEIFLYIAWIIPIILLSLIFNIPFSISTLLFSPSGFIACFIFIVLLIKLISNKEKIKELFNKIKLPEPIKYILTSLITLIILAFIIIGPSKFATMIKNLFTGITRAFSASRHATTVAENNPLTFSNLTNQFGWIFLIFVIIGAAVLIYKFFHNTKYKNTATYIFISYVILFIISKLLEASWLIILATLGVFIYLIINYFTSYYKNKDYLEKFKKTDDKFLFIILWLVILTYALSSAVRLMFEYSPIAAIVGSFGIVFVFKKITNTKKIGDTKMNTAMKIILIVILLFILLSPFTFYKGPMTNYYTTTSDQAKYVAPGLNIQWQMAAEWAKQNLPDNAIFAHWWDYGYWVQYAFQKPTVTDGGNQINWWNYLMGRNVLTANTFEEPLKFLKAHNVTHLLIVSDEIAKYGAYSFIGSDENLDRLSYISIFGLNPQQTQEKRNSTIYTYNGNFALDEDLIINNKVYPKSQAGIGAIKIETENIEINGTIAQKIKQPKAIIIYQNQAKEISMQCLFINGQEHNFEEYDYPGCFQIIPYIIDQNNMHPMGGGIFLSNRTYNSMITQLYLFNKENPYFKLVKGTQEEVNQKKEYALSLQQGRLVGPLKIWEVNYPKTLQLTQAEKDFFLSKEFLDEKAL